MKELDTLLRSGGRERWKKGKIHINWWEWGDWKERRNKPVKGKRWERGKGGGNRCRD